MIQVGSVQVAARIVHPLNGGLPGPGWHRPHERKRPCDRPVCMLCNFLVWPEFPDHWVGSQGREMRKVMLVGGTWEGPLLRKRIRDAISAAQNGRMPST